MDGQQEFSYKWNLSEETKKIAKDELREDDQIREQMLEQFRDWIRKHPSIKHCITDSNFLLRFLRTKKFSLPMAQKLLEKYIAVRELYPDWFHNLSVEEPEVIELIENGYILPLKERDYEGRTVVIFNVGRCDPHKYTCAHVIRTHSIVFEALMDDEENQIRGYTYIIDDSGFTMAHLSVWSLLDVRKMMCCVQSGLPMRHKQAYLINVPMYATKLVDFAISCLSDKLKSRCKAFKSIEELKNIIDLKILPEEWGGEVPLQDLIDSFKKTLQEKREKIEALKDLKIEIKPTENHFSCGDEFDGIFGSFRKLEVD